MSGSSWRIWNGCVTRKRTTRKRCGCWNEYESACTFGMKCAKRVTDRGKKGMLGYCVEAVLQRVEAEIRFSRERQEYPERYAGSSDDGPLAVWTSNNNKMEIAELMLGIYLAKVLRTPDGMLMTWKPHIAAVAGFVPWAESGTMIFVRLKSPRSV